jgi:hypothetical protein
VNQEVERRLGRNEALFREANEAIARGLWPGDGDGLVHFRCECARIDCSDPVALTPEEYERVRASGRRFVLRPGHELTEVESVVERRSGYLVVEKREEAATVAEELDPRA